MQIIPAIIPKSFEDLEEKMSAVAGLVPLVQVDVLDGSLVTGLRAWPYLEAARNPVKSQGSHGVNYADQTRKDAERNPDFSAIVSEERGFPFWQELEFEAHLMVREPERIISDWIAAGASRIIIQIEGAQDFGKCVEAADGLVPLGVSIALDTPRERLASIAEHVEVIQCMGWNLASLGRQGQPFDPSAIDAIRELRLLYPEHIISVDGGVNLENALSLLQAGADRLVVGSAIWKNGMVRDNLEKFKIIVSSI